MLFEHKQEHYTDYVDHGSVLGALGISAEEQQIHGMKTEEEMAHDNIMEPKPSKEL